MRTFVALLSAAVIGVTWYGWAFLRDLNEGVTTTDVISSSIAAEAGRKPLDGAVDILLVGMDSRLDAQGNPLSQEALDMLKGGIPDGEMNTDTMILVHIPVDGTRAVAISFPRDSYVELADDFGMQRLNAAFASQRNTTAGQLVEQGETDQKKIDAEAAAAGRKTLIKTIENLAGGSVSIDRYAEVNLASFYEVTKAIGGVDVCLNADTQDSDSGADFRQGVQTISGAQALSFVRQRKNLPNGDLDRIVRQQTFIGALAQKVLSSGTLTDTDKLSDLVTAVKKSVILSQGWDVATFAEQMSGLVGGNIQFRTIPIVGDLSVPGVGDVLEVDPAAVKQFITDLAGEEKEEEEEDVVPSSTTAADNANVTVSVVNASDTGGLAGTVLGVLGQKGFAEGVKDSGAIQPATAVLHSPGGEADAKKVVLALGGGVLTDVDGSLNPGEVVVRLGTDYAGPGSESFEAPDPGGAPAGSAGVSTSPSTSSTPPLTASGPVCVN
ncbi:LCP family protein [Umezawaea beigongshangensis]|uniref:LCP family protein n=1 Tax=Umezawaea beigongshangensis TaxID=2780383 RepID=UPI0027DB8878|nr:LCP family protein [Umezawaea beigongshangensis]